MAGREAQLDSGKEEIQSKKRLEKRRKMGPGEWEGAITFLPLVFTLNEEPSPNLKGGHEKCAFYLCPDDPRGNPGDTGTRKE
jgi:hypothetical protein